MTDDRDARATPLDNDQIAAAGLADWRKLAQALHARFLVGDYPAAVDEGDLVAELEDIRALDGADLDPAAFLPSAYRDAEELQAEVVEGERRSAERHAQLAAEAATHVHVRKGQKVEFKEAHEGGE